MEDALHDMPALRCFASLDAGESRMRAALEARIFHSLVSLQAAIKRYLVLANDHPRPFQWTKDPDKNIAAVRRGYQALDSLHQQSDRVRPLTKPLIFMWRRLP